MSRKRLADQLVMAALVVCLSAVTGCHSFDQSKIWNPLSQMTASDQPEYKQPVRMAVIWRETAINRPGRPATRGFGGRVYFYDQNNDAIRVDGELTVFAFDESTNGHHSNVPDRRYVFRRAELQKHFGETDLGASYSIWIPWDSVGGMRKTVALLPVFKPEKGTIIKSGQSLATLPGKTPESMTAEQSPGGLEEANLVRQVSAVYPANVSAPDRLLRDPTMQNRQRKPTTIRVPRSLGRRMNELSNLQRSQHPIADPSQSELNSNEKMRASLQNDSPVSNTAAQFSASQQPATATNINPPTNILEKPRHPRSRVFGQPGAFR